MKSRECGIFNETFDQLLESPWTLGVLCRVAQEYGLSEPRLGTSNLYQDWPRINMASSLQDVELPELDWQPWI